MKSLRKSLNVNKDTPKLQISTPLPLPAVSKPPSAILPPQKVIRALNSHRSQAPPELSFQKGDFFYVVSDGVEYGQYYEAHNPVTGARGLVPRQMFEEFNKNNPYEIAFFFATMETYTSSEFAIRSSCPKPPFQPPVLQPLFQKHKCSTPSCNTTSKQSAPTN